MVAVTGESGSGKSTLLRGVLGELKGEGVAYLPQQPHLFKASIRENVSLFQEVDDEEVKRILRRLRLEFELQQVPNGLSRGQLQRLGLARVLIQKRSIVLLDEPTSNLDRVTRQIVSGVIAQLVREHSLLVATHDSGLVGLADQVLELRGRELRSL